MIRDKLIENIAVKILSLGKDHPMRLAVDGITASGKTTFANELAETLKNKGKEVHRVSLDGFHNPKIVRYKKGRSSAEGYYYDAYNYNAIIHNLLLPLGPNGSNKYRTQVLDLKIDIESFSEKIDISKNAVLIVDGSFSLRRELYDHWDFTLYLSVEMNNAQRRAGERDKEFFGSKELAIETTKKRYHAAHTIHNELEKPWEKANVVVDNNDPDNAFATSPESLST